MPRPNRNTGHEWVHMAWCAPSRGRRTLNFVHTQTAWDCSKNMASSFTESREQSPRPRGGVIGKKAKRPECAKAQSTSGSVSPEQAASSSWTSHHLPTPAPEHVPIQSLAATPVQHADSAPAASSSWTSHHLPAPQRLPAPEHVPIQSLAATPVQQADPAPLPEPTVGEETQAQDSCGQDCNEAGHTGAAEQPLDGGKSPTWGNARARAGGTRRLSLILQPQHSISFEGAAYAQRLEPWASWRSSVWCWHLGLLALMAAYALSNLTPWYVPGMDKVVVFFVLSLWFCGLLSWVAWQDRVFESVTWKKALRFKRRRLESRVNQANFETRCEVWLLDSESTFTRCTLMGLFGTQADFMLSMSAALLVMGCQLTFLFLLMHDNETFDNEELLEAVNTTQAYDDTVSLEDYMSFPRELLCMTSTGAVIVVFVGGDVVNGVRLVALNVHVGLLKFSEEVRSVTCTIKATFLHEASTVDEEEEGPRFDRTRAELPLWSRSVFCILVSWCQVAVGLIIAE